MQVCELPAGLRPAFSLPWAGRDTSRSILGNSQSLQAPLCSWSVSALCVLLAAVSLAPQKDCSDCFLSLKPPPPPLSPQMWSPPMAQNGGHQKGVLSLPLLKPQTCQLSRLPLHLLSQRRVPWAPRGSFLHQLWVPPHSSGTLAKQFPPHLLPLTSASPRALPSALNGVVSLILKMTRTLPDPAPRLSLPGGVLEGCSFLAVSLPHPHSSLSPLKPASTPTALELLPCDQIPQTHPACVPLAVAQQPALLTAPSLRCHSLWLPSSCP